MRVLESAAVRRESVVAHPDNVAALALGGTPQLLLNRLHRAQLVELGITDELGLLCYGATSWALHRGLLPAVGAVAGARQWRSYR